MTPTVQRVSAVLEDLRENKDDRPFEVWAEAVIAAVQEWQPIETAPRDGTQIWAFRPDAHPDDQQGIAWWNSSRRGGLWEDPDDRDDAPTYWMPLPAPPHFPPTPSP